MSTVKISQLPLATGATGPNTFIPVIIDGENFKVAADTLISQGATGATGIQGLTGSTGPQGPIGDIGATGATGIQGLTGSTGPQGEQGSTGPQGLTGSTGPQGQQGATGDQGIQGATGDQGLTGSTGPQGSTGLVGATGLTGSTGPGVPTSGTNLGAAFFNGNTEELKISTGVLITDIDILTPAVITNQIISNFDVVEHPNITFGSIDGANIIVQGNGTFDGDLSVDGTFTAPLAEGHVWIGSTGGQNVAQPLTSVTGATGATGPQGIQGATGTAGTNGATGVQGLTGATGPQGATGPVGLTGATGLEGATGPDSSINPGSPVVINNSSDSNQTLGWDTSVSSVLEFNYTEGNLTANRIKTISPSNVVDGKIYTIVASRAPQAARTLTVRFSQGSTAALNFDISFAFDAANTKSAYAFGVGYNGKILWGGALNTAATPQIGTI